MSDVSVAEPDVTLHLDEHGVIREAALSDAITGEEVRGWVGRAWLDTVDLSGAEKARGLLNDARASGVSLLRHVVQRFPSGRELAMEYCASKVKGRAGGLTVLGRNLQAVADLQARHHAVQEVAEAEHWKLREIETRHRLLFDAGSEAVVLVAGAESRVIEANPAATQAVGLVAGDLFAAALMVGDQEGFVALLKRVREFGGAPGVVLRFEADRRAWAVRATLIAGGDEPQYLLRVTAVGVRPEPAAASPLSALVERLPDGFVIVDADGSVLHGNQAFLDLVQVGAVGAVQGHALGRWMAEPGTNAGVLLSAIRRHGSVRSFQTVLQGELGTEVSVEVSAAGHAVAGVESFGIALRDVGRRALGSDDHETRAGGEIEGHDGLIAQQLGRAPLSQVVRSAVEAIERTMIAAALKRSDGNRTAAAGLLGLSRQSLHSKLNRHAAECGTVGE